MCREVRWLKADPGWLIHLHNFTRQILFRSWQPCCMILVCDVFWELLGSNRSVVKGQFLFAHFLKTLQWFQELQGAKTLFWKGLCNFTTHVALQSYNVRIKISIPHFTLTLAVYKCLIKDLSHFTISSVHCHCKSFFCFWSMMEFLHLLPSCISRGEIDFWKYWKFHALGYCGKKTPPNPTSHEKFQKNTAGSQPASSGQPGSWQGLPGEAGWLMLTRVIM